MRFWEIDERALGDDQGIELSEDLAPRSGYKAVPNPRDIDQILSSVIPNNDGVDSMRSGNVASDHKFLSTVQPILSPRAAAFANLVPAVPPLGRQRPLPALRRESR
jgi:hypothetical protein